MPGISALPREEWNSDHLTVQECIPNPNELVILWSVFLDRVDPVTKILHIPTFRSRIVDAAANFHKIPLPTQGLLFSIFLTAVTSLSKQEHWDFFQRSKEDAIAAFSRGFKVVMSQFNYIRNYNLETLRALTIYSVRSSGHPTKIIS